MRIGSQTQAGVLPAEDHALEYVGFDPALVCADPAARYGDSGATTGRLAVFTVGECVGNPGSGHGVFGINISFRAYPA